MGQTWENVLFTSNTKVEKKFPNGESMWHEIIDAGYLADQTQVPVKASVKQSNCHGLKPFAS